MGKSLCNVNLYYLEKLYLILYNIQKRRFNILKNNPNNLTPKEVLLVVGLFIFFLFILPLIVISTKDNNNNTNTQGISLTSNGLQKINKNDFTLLKQETTGTRTSDGIYIVKGKIKQNIEGSYTGLMLTLNLLDANNKKIRETTGFIYTNYLGNNLWEFEVRGNDADNIVVNYEILSCYGY